MYIFNIIKFTKLHNERVSLIINVKIKGLMQKS